MSFEVRLEQFNGPLHKLLELIEQKELEVSRVSLAQVTGDFIKYVEGLEASVDSVVLSDFVVVASRLLLLKSKILLPNLEFTKEEEADIADLEKRLRIYREICSIKQGKSAAFYVNELWEKKQISQSRKFLASLEDRAVFYPPENVSADELEATMRKLANVLEKILPERADVSDNIVTLQDKIEELVDRLNGARSLSFNGSFKEEEKAEIVVLFLAVLHMLANKLADVEQGERFGEIKLQVNGTI